METDRTDICGYDIGNAQLKGMKRQQNDYFTMIDSKQALLLVIADGVSDTLDGKSGAVYAVEILKRNFKKLQNDFNIDDFFRYSFDEIEHRLRRNELNRSIRTSVICAVFENKSMLLHSFGNGKCFLYRNHQIKEIYVNSKYDTIKISMKQKDVFLLCSYGAIQSLEEYEIIDILSKNKSAYEKAEKLLECIKNKRYQWQKNATILVIQH